MTDDRHGFQVFQTRASVDAACLRETYGHLCLGIIKNVLQDIWLAEACKNEVFDAITLTDLEDAPSSLCLCAGRSRMKALEVYKQQPAGRHSFSLLLGELEDAAGRFRIRRDVVLERDGFRLVRLFLSKLSRKERFLFVERYWFLRSIPDLAQQYAISERNVRRTIFRLKKKLVTFGNAHLSDTFGSTELFSLWGCLEEQDILDVMANRDRIKGNRIRFGKMMLPSVIVIAAVVILGFVGMILSGMGPKPDLPKYMFDWDSEPISRRYPQISYDGLVYDTNHYLFAPEDLEGKLGEAQAGGWYENIFGKRKPVFQDVTVYQIKDVAPAFAVAVRYEGADGYYAAIGRDYVPDTLGQLVEDLNLREMMEINYVAHPVQSPKGGEHYDYIDTAIVWELLDSAQEAAYVYADYLETDSAVMWISVKVPWVQQENEVIYLFEDHMVTEFASAIEWFDVDPEVIEAFAEAISSVCDRKQP